MVKGISTGDDISGMYFTMQSNRASAALANLHRIPNASTFADLAHIFFEQTQINLSGGDVALILEVFPAVRGIIAEFGTDTESIGEFLSAMAIFFVGTPWPIYGDQLGEESMKHFVMAIRHVAKSMGYVVVVDE